VPLGFAIVGVEVIHSLPRYSHAKVDGVKFGKFFRMNELILSTPVEQPAEDVIAHQCPAQVSQKPHAFALCAILWVEGTHVLI
jgi:hypothetical protein